MSPDVLAPYLAVEVLVVVGVVNDHPHARCCDVSGDAFPKGKSDPQIPVEEEEFL